MWYPTKEEAEKARIEKEKMYGCLFVVLKDSEKENCWWAQRVISEIN